MGRIAVDLGNDAKDAVQPADPRKAAQSRHDDDAMDDLHRRLFSLLRTRLQTTEADPQGVSTPVDRCE